MIKAKYITGYGGNSLTINKIYDVFDLINIENYNRILIENDQGIKGWYSTIGSITGKNLFIDVTTEYRSDIINDILK